jgi:hypothetical protein
MLDAHGLNRISDHEWIKRELVDRLLGAYDLPERAMINQMSTLKYEKRELHTGLCNKNAMDSKCMSIRLDRKISLHSSLSVARKLLELAGDRGTLVLKKTGEDFTIVGVAQNLAEKKYARVEFEGYMKWTLLNGDQPICKYRDGEDEFIGIVRGSNAVSAAFGEIEAELEQILYELPECMKKKPKLKTSDVKAVLEEIYKKSSHGTAMIFMDKKTRDSELDRLCKVSRAYKIEAIGLNDSKVDLKGVASIDGAMIAGFDMKCYAVGAILDGAAVICGDAGRGARYNSVLNYACWIYKQYEDDDPSIMAMIRSEDGMVTLKTTSDLKKMLEQSGE